MRCIWGPRKLQFLKWRMNWKTDVGKFLESILYSKTLIIWTLNIQSTDYHYPELTSFRLIIAGMTVLLECIIMRSSY